MARYFPRPCPDESIYSIFVRYDKDTGIHNYFATVQTLIGKIHLKAITIQIEID